METSACDDDILIARSFRELGVIEPICAAISALGWKTPTLIQQNALPEAFNGRDIIGLAETGSGDRFCSC